MSRPTISEVTLDNTVITPGPGQALISTSDHHRGHHDRRNLDELIVEEVNNGFRATASDTANGFRATASDSTAGFRSVATDTANGFRSAAQDAKDIQVEVKDVECKVVDKIGDDTARVLSAVTHGTEEAQENYARLQKQVSDNNTATALGFKDAQALAYQVEGRALLEAAKNANALGVQADKLWYQTNLQAQTNAAAAVLLATQNQAAILAAQAECCCELKEKITAEAVETRALINTIESNRIRDELASCKAQNAAYFARGIPPVTP